MKISVLGPLTVTRDGRPVPLRGVQPKLLLALLALEPGRAVGADRLIDALWGEHLPAEPANALQVVAARLRRQLAPDQHVVVSRPPGYLLALGPEQVDAARFESLSAQARAAEDPERAAGLLSAALGLWRGDALADLRGNPAADAAAARLEELRLATLEERIEADLALGRHAHLVGELQTLIAQAPLRERLHAQLMRALYAGGRQADALTAYQRARTLLAERAGLDPGPELRHLEHQLLTQDPALAAQGPGRRALAEPAEPRERPASPPPPTLRTPPTSFIGREHEIREVRALLGRGRLVTLVGPGGAGKTRLALEVAGQLLADGAAGPDGVRLADLAPLRDPALLPPAVLDAVSPRTERARPGAPPSATGVTATAELVRTLAGRRLLLILDNCEHLIQAAAGLAQSILDAAGGVRILATSREALRVPGEARLPVPALPVPPEDLDDPEGLLDVAACRLFVERGQAVSPGFAAATTPGREDPDTARAVAEICRRLDGLPLAIELAAARVSALPAPELAARLDDRFRLLTSGARTALPRHQTLRAVVDWSWELLAEPERVALRRLAVFTGGCTLTAAERVCAGPGLAADEVPAAVAGLVDKSLVEVGPGPALPEPWWPGIEDAGLPAVPDPPPAAARYRLLETVRAYAAERLAEAGETEAVERAHAAWCVAEAEAAWANLHRGQQLAWRTRVHAERGNLHTGLRWLLDHGDADGAVGVARLVWWGLTGPVDGDTAGLSAALALPGGTRDRARAEALVTLALRNLRTEQPATAEQPLAEAEAAFTAAGAVAHARLVAALRRSLHQHDQHHTAPVTGMEFEQLLDAVIAEGGWTPVTAWCAMLTGVTGIIQQLTTGDLAGGRRAAEAWLARLERLGDRLSMIDGLDLLSAVSAASGDPTEAEAHLRRALRIACELRYPTEITAQFGMLGELELGRGNLPAARAHLTQALAAAAQLGMPDITASIHNGLGMVAATVGDHITARQEHEQALTTYRQSGDQVGVAATQALLGLATAREGNRERAEDLHRQALEAARQAGDPALLRLVLEARAAVAVQAGQPERAALLLGAAQQDAPSQGMDFIGRSAMSSLIPPRLPEDPAEAARRALGEEAFEKALEKGRALALHGVVEDG